MVRKAYTPEQIINKLREAELLLNQGANVGEVSRKIGSTEQTYYRWRREYGGLRIEQARKLKNLEKENARLKKLLEMELESLVVPQANAAEEAGKLILDLPRLWANANAEERRRLLLTMLDAVYVDAKKTKSIIAVKPKPPFKPVFQVAASKEESDISIINEPYNGSSVFLVEAGESRTPRPKEATQNMLQA